MDNFTSLRLTSCFLKRQVCTYERVEKLAYYTFEELMKQTEEVIRQRKSYKHTHTHTHTLAHIYRLFFQQESLRKCILPLANSLSFFHFRLNSFYFDSFVHENLIHNQLQQQCEKSNVFPKNRSLLSHFCIINCTSPCERGKSGERISNCREFSKIG